MVTDFNVLAGVVPFFAKAGTIIVLNTPAR
jgi:hypothetical protein